MASNTSTKKVLEEVMGRDANKSCADCGLQDPDWCNIRVGVLICKVCAGIHRGLGASLNRVKSIKLDSWNLDETDKITGNEINAELEKFIPVYYTKPKPTSQTAVKESFIWSKYEGRLFQDEVRLKESTIGSGEKNGFLHKKGKSKETWKPRFFVLKGDQLEYFIKIDDTQPKACVPIKDIGLNLEEINENMFAMAISYYGASRSYYAYSDNNMLTIEWYYTILCAQHKIALEGEGGGFEASLLGGHLQRSGYLYKPGPAAKDAWRKRWFFLNKGYLSYYKEKLDPHPKGEIKLGKKTDGFEVRAGDTEHLKQAPFEHTFQLQTPGRKFKLCAETRDDMVNWVKLLDKTINEL